MLQIYTLLHNHGHCLASWTCVICCDTGLRFSGLVPRTRGIDICFRAIGTGSGTLFTMCVPRRRNSSPRLPLKRRTLHFLCPPPYLPTGFFSFWARRWSIITLKWSKYLSPKSKVDLIGTSVFCFEQPFGSIAKFKWPLSPIDIFALLKISCFWVVLRKLLLSCSSSIDPWISSIAHMHGRSRF